MKLESQQRSQRGLLPGCDMRPRFVLFSKQTETPYQVTVVGPSLGPSVVFDFETHHHTHTISSPPQSGTRGRVVGALGVCVPLPTAVVEPNFRKVLRNSLVLYSHAGCSFAGNQASGSPKQSSASLQRGRHVARATECCCEVRVMLEWQECDL